MKKTLLIATILMLLFLPLTVAANDWQVSPDWMLPSHSPTPTSTPTATLTPTPSSTPSATPSATPTPTPEPTETATPKPTASPTPTPSPKPEPTPEPTPTPTTSQSPIPTSTPTPTTSQSSVIPELNVSILLFVLATSFFIILFFKKRAKKFKEKTFRTTLIFLLFTTCFFTVNFANAQSDIESSTNIVAGEPATFRFNGSVFSGASFIWSWGDDTVNTTTSEPQANHIYGNTGEYTITLTVMSTLDLGDDWSVSSEWLQNVGTYSTSVTVNPSDAERSVLGAANAAYVSLGIMAFSALVFAGFAVVVALRNPASFDLKTIALVAVVVIVVEIVIVLVSLVAGAFATAF